ncbi:MAG: murein L,D-transpeptidase catalytic domain family protein [Gemmatimonadales bacterium]
MFRLARITIALGVAVAACAPPRPVHAPWPDRLPPAPDGMSPGAWIHAHAAHERVRIAGHAPRSVLAIIDFSLPSNEPRLWVIDLETHEVIAQEYVAHGWGSGGTWAISFSNQMGSKESSLGTFLTAEAFFGVRGLSLRLRGLEPGINDRAQARGIVFHGTPNVSAARAALGTVGRTEGCPAVPIESARPLVKLLEGGAVLFVWYPDPYFLAHSDYLDRTAVANYLGGSQ